VRCRRSDPRILVVGGLSAAVVTCALRAVSRDSLTGSTLARWHKRNYRDREVTLLLGPAVALGALAGIASAGPTGRRGALLAVSSAALVGGYDDLYGDRHARGLGGHASALRQGRVTTGIVKLAVLVGGGAIAAVFEQRELTAAAALDVTDAALRTVLVAGGANLVNLFDLRPGRAVKVSLLAAAALSAGADAPARALAAVAAGTALAALPADLGERAMLGDCGAGTIGALLGWSAGLGGSRRRRSVLAAGVAALTLVSERVSFSELIARQPALAALDRLGRTR
jgi:hypothetical protein